ncbi:NUDIX hydrolase [Amycolatopsis anabasis]|uniref:NUDIX hydrolase n=1 Tax=Amycolatopsis anabasis TaxID=1840409 RepID=UPI001FEC8791|nr:NUDIX hydrolase [Amycolatopsis anabasis]
MSGTPPIPEILAGGAALWRQGEGGLEVAVVHRPRYDDWSLPKGKVDRGETIQAAAVREVREETGFSCVLGRHLRVVRYPVPARRGGGTVGKAVHYFSARATGGEFTPNDEVDALRWLSPAEAEALLTHPADVDVLRTFCALPAELTTILLVRHAKAGKREDWNSDDDLRPLAEAGFRQAEALRRLTRLFGPDRVLAAPRLRCVQTVQGVAEDLGGEVRHEPLLAEEGYWADPVLGLARLLAIVTDGGTPLICSQGAVIPDIVAQLADRDGVELPGAATKNGKVACKKGSLWLLSFRPATDRDGPRLVDADYFATALPAPEPARS